MIENEEAAELAARADAAMRARDYELAGALYRSSALILEDEAAVIRREARASNARTLEALGFRAEESGGNAARAIYSGTGRATKVVAYRTANPQVIRLAP